MSRRPSHIYVAALALMASSAALHAQVIDLANCAQEPPRHIFTTEVGKVLQGAIGVINSSAGQIYWGFETNPVGLTQGATCTGATPAFVCNGITIRLPASPDDPVPNDAQVTVSGTPSASGIFAFKLAVSSGNASCAREYRLEIAEEPTPPPPPPPPVTPKPPVNLGVG
jgi:hypothetical protein